jgi:phosphoribosylformylglycinamidine synthase subunit PurQ / glutaminase
MKFGVVVFPGSNCDHDTYHVISKVIGQPVKFIWHKETDLDGCDAVLLPGGFSYGDYLRCGAIAGFSPVMQSVKRFARDGGFVMGICNGFQILCESGLLPGALLRNAALRFRCEFVHVRVERADTAFTCECAPHETLELPIAHGEGNYFCTPEQLAELEANRQIVLRYADAAGNVTAAANPNGSLANVAGVMNRDGNVFGLMPHPERVSEDAVGGSDGLRLLRSLLRTLTERERARR